MLWQGWARQGLPARPPGKASRQGLRNHATQVRWGCSLGSLVPHRKGSPGSGLAAAVLLRCSQMLRCFQDACSVEAGRWRNTRLAGQ